LITIFYGSNRGVNGVFYLFIIFWEPENDEKKIPRREAGDIVTCLTR
jgi:hypothetical protein